MSDSHPFKVIQDEQPWYKEGLHFECTGCGQCCTGAPGYVWVTEEEIAKMAQYLGITVQRFAMLYLRKVHGRYSLVESRSTFDCVFLKDKKCKIYPVRPSQCSTFPWWTKHLSSEEEWKKAAAYCEGIKFEGKLVPRETIDEQLNIYEKNNNNQ